MRNLVRPAIFFDFGFAEAVSGKKLCLGEPLRIAEKKIVDVRE